MSHRYYKRYRMMIDLRHAPDQEIPPPGYGWLAWNESLVDAHAWVKHQSFADQIDAEIFPTLSTFDRCRELMSDIVSRIGFISSATWLLASQQQYVGTVQGVVNSYGHGMIQNIGIIPAERGKGLGRKVLLKALAGFRYVGLNRATLEVTADNHRAVTLYRNVGFRLHKVLYKAVETPQSPELAHS